VVLASPSLGEHTVCLGLLLLLYFCSSVIVVGCVHCFLVGCIGYLCFVSFKFFFVVFIIIIFVVYCLFSIFLKQKYKKISFFY
jgi:hypothetical protein